jgi:lactate dehydrogenase-like 2-hydroxyacid dehydrogenase
MKVVAYSVKPYEKESLAKANQKKHDITLIFNSLSLETAMFAAGKQAVIISAGDDVGSEVMDKLAAMGVKYITTRSTENEHIDRDAAARHHIKLANATEYSKLQDIAIQTIKNLDLWELDKCVGNACICANNCRLKH